MAGTIKKKNELDVKPIRTVRDLMRATIKKGATLGNGGYDLFGEEIKKYMICKGGKLMTWDDWYKKPHPSISETVDAEFEIIETPPKKASLKGKQAALPQSK